MTTPGELIARHYWLKAELAKIDEAYEAKSKWYKDGIAAIANELLRQANEQNVNSFNSDDGTAYKSTLMNIKVADEQALLDFCLDQWETFGSEMLKVSALKPGVEKWLESTEYKMWQIANPGLAAPGVEVSYFTRINIRKS